MSARQKAVTMAALVIVAGAIVLWRFLATEKAGQEAGAATPSVQQGVPAATTGQGNPATPLAEAETADSAIEEVLAEIPRPSPAVAGGSGPAAPVKGTSTPEVEALFAEMSQSLGWDKINTIEVVGVVTVGEKTVAKAKVTMEKPSRVLCLAELDENGVRSPFYQLSDGVFMEQGTFGTDGSRTPIAMFAFDGIDNGLSPLLDDKYLDPAFYQQCEAVKADPNERIFQKEDGTPIDNLDLLRLSGKTPKASFELYLDSQTKRPVAARVSQDDGGASELFHLKLAEVAPGVLYPVEMEQHATGPDVRIGSTQYDEVTMKYSFKPEEVKVNCAVDPSTFRFRTGAPK